MDFETKYILVIPPLFPLYFVFSPLPFLSIYVAGLNFLPIPELLALLFPILVKKYFLYGKKMYNSVLRLHFPLPKKCQNYTQRGCLNQGFVYTNCHVSTAKKLFWRLEPAKKGSYRNFPIFFPFLSASPQRNTFPFSPFPPPAGDSREKGKKGKRKILDFLSRIFFKSRRAPGKI